ARDGDGFDRPGARPAIRIIRPLDAVELHTHQPSVLNHEPAGSVVLDDLYAFLLGIGEFPWRSLEMRARAPCDHLYVRCAQAKSGPAAVHRRVADADDEYSR